MLGPRYGNNTAGEAIIFGLSCIVPRPFTHLGFQHVLTIVDYYPTHTPTWN